LEGIVCTDGTAGIGNDGVMPLQLRTIDVENFKNFQLAAHVNVAAERDAHPFLVIVGKNGAGKVVWSRWLPHHLAN